MDWNFDHQILIQGIDQPQALNYIQENNLNNINIIAGIADEYIEEKKHNIPVFDLVKEALIAYPNINTSLIFNHPYRVLDAVYEAIELDIQQIIIYTENIPPQDLCKLFLKVKRKQVNILGNSLAGILIPEKNNCGVHNAHLYKQGNIAILNCGDYIVSQELAIFFNNYSLGESIIINFGNSNFNKINWDFWLKKITDDQQTEIILIVINNFAHINKNDFLNALNSSSKNGKKIIIYYLDFHNINFSINNDKAKIITDLIPEHLERILSHENLNEYFANTNVIITNNYYKIPELI